MARARPRSLAFAHELPDPCRTRSRLSPSNLFAARGDAACPCAGGPGRPARLRRRCRLERTDHRGLPAALRRRSPGTARARPRRRTAFGGRRDGLIRSSEARPPCGGRASFWNRFSGELADVLRLQPLGTLDHFELDLLPLREGAEALGLDGGVVAENVFTAAVLRDEAEALGVVEPLHSSSRHSKPVLLEERDG